MKEDWSNNEHCNSDKCLPWALFSCCYRSHRTYQERCQVQVDTLLSSRLWQSIAGTGKTSHVNLPKLQQALWNLHWCFQVTIGHSNSTRQSTISILFMKAIRCSNNIYSHWAVTSFNWGKTSRIPLYPSRWSNQHLHRSQEPYIQQLYYGSCLSLGINCGRLFTYNILHQRSTQHHCQHAFPSSSTRCTCARNNLNLLPHGNRTYTTCFHHHSTSSSRW